MYHTPIKYASLSVRQSKTQSKFRNLTEYNYFMNIAIGLFWQSTEKDEDNKITGTVFVRSVLTLHRSIKKTLPGWALGCSVDLVTFWVTTGEPAEGERQSVEDKRERHAHTHTYKGVSVGWLQIVRLYNFKAHQQRSKVNKPSSWLLDELLWLSSHVLTTEAVIF